MPATDNTPPLLTLRGLKRLHVGPVDLALSAGECVSVMGHSGAGKSVLLRMVADLDPHEGDAFLAGGACSGMPAPAWRRQVGYVPADAGWWAETVAPHFPPDFDFAVLLPAASRASGAWRRTAAGDARRAPGDAAGAAPLFHRGRAVATPHPDRR